jgi:putative SOS response-associated peptidase YedK
MSMLGELVRGLRCPKKGREVEIEVNSVASTSPARPNFSQLHASITLLPTTAFSPQLLVRIDIDLMCGRYALGIVSTNAPSVMQSLTVQRASFVRHQLQEQGLPVDDAPDDDEARETYNFPPGAYGLVYRADVPDQGVVEEQDDAAADDGKAPASSQTYNYQIKVMKWGLIPFWTKRSPDYGSMMKTINCRDDSLAEDRGMWTSMKRKKRCIVVAQGFYEWLKKGPGGKDKVPHFVKRKDGNLMCFAGLWDCVKYEDSEDKLYTYTIITTDSNKQLKFLHDRMPVILDPGTEAIKTWLDPKRTKWSKDLQALLKPFAGELDCYPVSQEVGKVGNNSPNFIVPVDSKENKKNIANFFGNAKIKEKTLKDPVEPRATSNNETTEDNAPLPAQLSDESKGTKRALEDANDELPKKQPKIDGSPQKEASPAKNVGGKVPRSATSNQNLTMKASPGKKSEQGNQRITSFFAK